MKLTKPFLFVGGVIASIWAMHIHVYGQLPYPFLNITNLTNIPLYTRVALGSCHVLTGPNSTGTYNLPSRCQIPSEVQIFNQLYDKPPICTLGVNLSQNRIITVTPSGKKYTCTVTKN